MSFTPDQLRSKGYERDASGAWRKSSRPAKALAQPDAIMDVTAPSKAPAGRISAENDPLHGANKLERRYAAHYLDRVRVYTVFEKTALPDGDY